MDNLPEAVERICTVERHLKATDALVLTMVETLPPVARAGLAGALETHAQATGESRSPAPPDPRHSVEAVMLTATRVSTFAGSAGLTGASGFFFRHLDRLFLVTNRHVLVDETSAHHPDRIEIELHTNASDLTQYMTYSIPLFQNGLSLWRDAKDSAGAVDVAVIEIDTRRLPANAVLHAFDATHLDPQGEDVTVGDALTVIGFPLGFHDTVHHLAVARSASLASAYGVRFQQQGYFLTDARTHRGSSGAPVLRRRRGTLSGGSPASWQLLGVHSTRMDMRSRDLVEDESLGLNCVWYADVLMTLTESTARPAS